MGGGMPYLYSPSSNNGGEFAYNPRAYTQATYAAALEDQMPKPERKGPLVDLNRHPDSWEVIASSKPEVAPVSASFRTKVLACRWTQLVLRVLQIISALGLLVCIICTKGIPDVQAWIMRILPGYDTLLNLYAIYHLARAADKRPPRSSASYSFFALTMDCALIPFYVYTAIFSYSNFKQVSGTEGRWTTFFADVNTTNLILEAVFLASSVLAGFHFLSMIADFLLLIWFRKISNLPPDMNPLSNGKSKVSKHKYKNSELSASTMSLSEKKLSTYSIESSASLPEGYSVPDPSPAIRQVPFMRSRMDSEVSFSPHTQATAQAARAGAYSQLYQQPASARSSQLSMHHARSSPLVDANGVHSPYAGHSFPYTPGQQRGSNTSLPIGSAARPSSRPSPRPSFQQGRSNTASPAPYAAQDPRAARANQTRPLLNNTNWTVHDDSADLGVSHQQGRAIAPPPRSPDRPCPASPVPRNFPAKVSAPALDKENQGTTQPPQTLEGDIRRQLTVSSSVYSDDGARSVASSVSTARPAGSGKRYGDLASPIEEDPSSPEPESRWFGRPMQGGGGGGARVVSRTGVELSDGADPFEVAGGNARMRNVSGKGAEEGRAAWFRRP